LNGEAEARTGPLEAHAIAEETTGSSRAETVQPGHVPSEHWTARELATLKRASKRTVAAATGIGVIVGLVSALLTTLFVVVPNLKPSTTNLVAITNVVVEPNVTFAQYLQHPSTALGLRARGMSVDDIRRRGQAVLGDRATEAGASVDFQFEVRGYGGATLQTRWTLFDGVTGERLAESEQIDLLTFAFFAQKKEADIGTWEVWVRTFDQGRKSYFVRIEMYDVAAGTRLTFKDSDKFSPSP
jgi:hypothetical protein